MLLSNIKGRSLSLTQLNLYAMILILVLLFLLLRVEIVVGAEYLHAHDENNASQQEYPPVPVRVKRDLMSMVVCPSGAALSDDFGHNSEIILYSSSSSNNSDSDLRDNIIIYGNDGWSDEKMKLLVENGGFDSTKPTILFVHGFHQSAWSPWLMDVRSIYKTMFSSGGPEASFNLIFFDWSSYPTYRYWASVSHMPYIGKILGEFLYQLSESKRYDMEKVHLIGYSLSTHIIGLAGRFLTSNYGLTIGQLTALDPTGVCFHDLDEFGEENALRSTDAKLVVARHYNMDGLGAKRLIGGLDILVNGGIDQPRDDQDFPGSKHIHDTSIVVMANQDHHRATEHETHAAFDRQCHQIAYECDNYEAYLRGECADCGIDGSKCYLVNNFSKQQLESDNLKSKILANYAPGTKMFLKTHHCPSYCLHHYQLIVHLKSNASTEVLTLFSSQLVELDLGGNHRAQFWGDQTGNGKFTTLASSESKIESLEGINLRVQADNSITEALLNSLDYMEMNYMSNLLPSARAKSSFKICPRLFDTPQKINQNKSLIECP